MLLYLLLNLLPLLSFAINASLIITKIKNSFIDYKRIIIVVYKKHITIIIITHL